MVKRGGATVLVIAAWACVPVHLFAQDPRVSITPRETFVKTIRERANIRVDADLVLVPVLVTDHSNQLIDGLDKKQFRLFDDNVEQEIRHFSSEDAPVSSVIVFDTSRSMKDDLDSARDAVSEFLKASNPEDEFALVQFSDRARVAVHLTPLTGEISNRLAFFQAKGTTALLDAIWMALDELKHARYSRKALFIISDGGDNHSRYSQREILKRAQEADVQIYSIGIISRYGPLMPEEANGPFLLDAIARSTGGQLIRIGNRAILPEVASRIAAAMRNQYVLGYSPSNPKRDGKNHRIKVQFVTTKGEPKFHVSFRSSYRSSPSL